MENSPWTLQMEINGGQTTLTARLHKRTEFKILCERVEMKTPDGAVQALGKVSFTTAGLRGACQRLTIPLNEDRLLLEGKAEVQMQQGTPPAETTVELKGDQLHLRLQAPAAENPGLRPATFSFPLPGLAPQGP
jgi:hypothetical protein